MTATALKPKDYASDQEVRWCPGCGDYAILKATQKTLADLGAQPENTAFISGIGCAARFPYYINTYGFHTIHGRAAAFATGAKLANPDLDVWTVSGDGDSLSIGGNHLFHLLRRNVNITYLLFNNAIYGLTKGQYSPTSRPGQRSPSSPGGSVEPSAHATLFALGARARFVARGADVLQKQLVETMKAAHDFPGTGFVEILQNCIVYNDGAFAGTLEKGAAETAQIHVTHGRPLRFGPEGRRGLRLAGGGVRLEVVTPGEGGVTDADVLIHDETDRTMAGLLAAMEGPEMPVAMGVIYRDMAGYGGTHPTFDDHIRAARAEGADAPEGLEDLQAILNGGHTWEVPATR